MQREQLHDERYLQIFWDGKMQIIGIDWKEATAAMSTEEFKTDLMLFASHVEMKKAKGIMVDVAKFRHRMEPQVQDWRVKNISPRYSAAGVKRFAFLFPPSAQIPPMLNQSSPGEAFETRAFQDLRQAEDWLNGS